MCVCFLATTCALLGLLLFAAGILHGVYKTLRGETVDFFKHRFYAAGGGLMVSAAVFCLVSAVTIMGQGALTCGQ